MDFVLSMCPSPLCSVGSAPRAQVQATAMPLPSFSASPRPPPSEHENLRLTSKPLPFPPQSPSLARDYGEGDNGDNVVDEREFERDTPGEGKRAKPQQRADVEKTLRKAYLVHGEIK